MPIRERARDHAGAARPAASRVLKGGPSKLRGVIWHKSNGKWEARIYEAGKQRFLGYYTSEIAAAKAYDTRAVQLHGAAARVNFPEDHEETRYNPPAVKSACATLAAVVPRTDSPDRLRRKSPRGSSWNSTTTRSIRRRDEGVDEDYVQPFRYTTQQQAHTLPSLRRLPYRQPTLSCLADSQDSESEPESEDSLKQGAVEVLATLLSGSSCEGGLSGHSSLANQGSGALAAKPQLSEGVLLESHESLPSSSTGASPLPAQKPREWAAPSPPAISVQGSPGQSSSKIGEDLSAGQLQDLKKAAEAQEEDCADSLQATLTARPVSKQQLQLANNDGSCSEDADETHAALDRTHGSQHKGVSWNSACRKWVAVIWDFQAKQARQLGAFDDPEEAARAYSTCAMQLQGQLTSLPEVSEQEPLTAALVSSCLSAQVPLKRQASATHVAHVDRIRAGLPGKVTTAAKAAAIANGRSVRGSSRFRGVSWCEKGQKWRALIWDGHRQHFLGHFKSEEEGARAYDRALLARKKKDGLLNFPLSDYADLVEQAEDLNAFNFLKPGQANLVVCTRGAKPEGSTTTRDGHRPSQNLLRLLRTSESAEEELAKEADMMGPSTPFEAEAKAASKAGIRTPDRCKYSLSGSSSQFKGVSWSSRSGKWRSQIWLGSKIMHLGLFEDELSAARAYEAAVATQRPYVPASAERSRATEQAPPAVPAGTLQEAWSNYASGGEYHPLTSIKKESKCQRPDGHTNSEAPARASILQASQVFRGLAAGSRAASAGDETLLQPLLKRKGPTREILCSTWGSKRPRN